MGGIVVAGVYGAIGGLGPDGPWLGLAGAVASLWLQWRHKWPSELPMRQRTLEQPQGPDEKAVMVEFRHDGTLLGWDVGILWFERGGVGFVGRTVSFVLPRALMAPAPPLPALQALLRTPQLTAKVFETTVGFVPLAPELRAEMTLARIDALPNEITSETILPPSTMHPDLLQRGQAVRRRLPALIAILGTGIASMCLPSAFGAATPGPSFGLTRGLLMVTFLLVSFLGHPPLPGSIRERLPK